MDSSKLRAQPCVKDSFTPGTLPSRVLHGILSV